MKRTPATQAIATASISAMDRIKTRAIDTGDYTQITLLLIATISDGQPTRLMAMWDGLLSRCEREADNLKGTRQS